MSRKNNSKFKKTVDEISNILTEEVKKETEKNKQTSESKENLEINKHKHRVILFGVIFFTAMIIVFWSMDVYSFLKTNKTNSETTNLIKNTKQDISDVLNTFKDKENTLNQKIEDINQEIKKENDLKQKTEELENEPKENEILQKILVEIKQYNTSTEKQGSENNI